MINVTAAIILHNNRVLAARRASHKHMGGYWEFPGGKIELGETPEQSLARELQEELGITARVGEHFYSHQHNYGDKQIMLMAYLCTWGAGELILNDHDAIQWCSALELSSLSWAPADIPIVGVLQFAMARFDTSPQTP